MTIRRYLVLLPLALVSATPTHAQLGGATIVVRVRDEQAAVVPGALVEAVSESGRVVARSDGKGIAVLANVPAGRVKLQVVAQGFNSWDQRHAVVAGEVIVARVVLDIGPHERVERIGPFDQHAFWDVRGRFDSGLQRELGGSASVWSALETSEPAAIMDRIDGPGLYLGEPGRFSMHGSSWTQNSVALDGLDITDGLGGGMPLTYPDPGAFGAIDVTSALAPVEYGVPGVTLALTPREPSQNWRGQAQGYWAPSSLQAKPRAADVPSIARLGSLADANALLSGPIAGQRLGVVLSGRAFRAGRIERDRPDELDAELGSLLGHLRYQAGERDTLRLVTSFQALRRPFDGRARFSNGTVAERDDFIGTQVRWEHTGERGSWSAFAGMQQGLFRPEIDGRVADRAIERLVDGPVQGLVFPGQSRRRTWTAGANMGLGASRVLGLWFAPRYGVTVTGATATEQPNGGDVTAELVNGIPARVWDYGYAGPASRRHTFDIGAYAADRVVFRDRLFVEAGLRLDATRGSAEGAAQGIRWTGVSPRISARLRLTDFGRMTLFGGYGRYRHRLLLDALAFGDPGGAQGSVYRWNDLNGDRLFSPNERGVLVLRVAPGSPNAQFSTIDPQLRPTRTREFVAGIEMQRGRSWLFRLTAFDRRERDRIESINFGAPLSSYDVRNIADPAGDLVGTQDDQLLPVFARKPATFGLDRYLLTNPACCTAKHQGLELRVERTFGERLRVLAGAMAYRTEATGANRGFRVFENDQGVIGELYDDQNANTFASGRTFFDRAFVAKASVLYRAPGDVSIGTVARYHDGQPFARYVVVADLPQGASLIPAVPRGPVTGAAARDAQGRYVVPSGSRFKYTLTWDVRLEKGVRWGQQRVALSAEVFNLLNLRREVEENVATGPAYRTPTAIQPPRAFRLGLRYEF